MIGYIEGILLQQSEDRLLVLAHQIGYEILVPPFVLDRLKHKKKNDIIALYIYYHQTERQPKPTLIGFNDEVEKEFFQMFITVEDVGPLKAMKALNISIRDIAAAIESKDTVFLEQLKGIGKRTAQKIVATLEGKMQRFIGSNEVPSHPQRMEDMIQQVQHVLVSQLGHKAQEAKQLVADALKRNKKISTPEELFDEIYRGEKTV